MKRILRSVLVALMMMAPAAAFAADGYVITNVNMRAGPDSQYPAIQVLPVNTWVSVQGCTTGWAWCDVISGPNRGWVAGTYIAYMYNSQPVYVADYGSQIGIPIVSFVIASYWGNYYSNRPFYRDRARWYGRPIVIRPPARPPMRPRPPVRPPPGGNRPQPPGGGNRPQPPGGGNRPQPPGGGNRPQPPGSGNRPQPPGGNRPQPPGGGNRPQPPGGGNRPQPPGGGNRPPPSNNNGNRPSPRPNPQQGNNGNNGN
ncbi:SH3 domain-containing protein [Dyella caseinilytica]|uniref:SH3 domain-containing protein n=1 Tax=Dyella caseinilytica TaxID=1849581 RepID=A0ABX7GRN3_9GAMM|nr:SH3 domain-containing protein [Dyella caseinilytica]QRN52482.1 SH3 domain-containing protein [Dyella caseinilytica]